MTTAAPASAHERPRGDAAPHLSRRQVNAFFGTVLMGMLLSALDGTIVSTALPTIVADLGGGGHISWVVTSYLLTETIAIILAGKLGDLFGRKRVFQVSILVFVVGSFFCGLATDLTALVVMRAVQGLGAGGMAVTATALIADVIPLRDRGKYQGAMGAVFGVTTVIGPLLGGYFTDSLSWRWAFYVNVPIAAVVLVLTARTLPGSAPATRPRIDYAGALLAAITATGLTLATTWGGSRYSWDSTTIVGLYAGSLAAALAFVVVELRAAEPILPMHLFRSAVFSIGSLLSFIVGFTMLGSLIFLPTYLQFVMGASATMSGIRTLPMVVGLLITALLSGAVIGRTGRYKAFPVCGMAITAVGLQLLSRMDETTSVLSQSLSMFVLGSGLGLAMQVLTIVVQSSVPYRDLGSATSGITFFRTLGSAFGAAVMGTFYANRLADGLPAALSRAGIADPSAVSGPSAVHALTSGQRAPIVGAHVEALQAVFLYSIPVALLGLLVAVLLPQVTLRDTARATVRGAGQGFALPEGADADSQLELVIGRVLERQAGGDDVLRRSATGVDAATAWGVMGIHLTADLLGVATRQGDVEARVGVPPGVLTSFFDELVDAGLVERTDDVLELTGSGRQLAEAIDVAWKDWLLDQVREWLPELEQEEARPLVLTAVERIARRAMSEEQTRGS